MRKAQSLLIVLPLAIAGIGAAGWLFLRTGDGATAGSPSTDGAALAGGPEAVNASGPGNAAAAGPEAPAAPEVADPGDDSDLDRTPHGEEGGPSVEQILAALALGTPQGWLDAERMLAVAGTDDPRVTDALIKALQDGRFRGRAADLARFLKDPAALARFLDVAKSEGDDGTRAAALRACAAMGGTGVFEAVTDILRSAKPGGLLAAAAAGALGSMGTPDAARVLLESLRDALGTPRQSLFAEALSRVRDPEALAELARMAADAGTDPQMRSALVDALGRSGCPEAVPELLKVARSDADASLKYDVYRALARVGTPEAVEELMNILHGADDAHKAQAAMALAEIRSKAAGPLLDKALAGPMPPELRSFVVEALGRAGSAASVEGLGKIARDASEPEGLRRSALKSIGEIGAPAGADVAFDVLESASKDDAPLRQTALGILKGTATAADLPRVEKLLEQATPQSPEWFHLEAISQALKKGAQPSLLKQK